MTDQLLKDFTNSTYFSFQLSSHALKTLDWIAAQRGGISRKEAIELALSDEKFFVEAVKSNKRVFVEENPSKPGSNKSPRSLVEVGLLVRS